MAQNARLHGVVYADANANGKRDASEPGVSGVIVSNQRDVVVTDSLGRFEIPTGTTGIVFVSVPDGFRSSDAFWRAATPATASVDFGVVRQAHLRTFSLSWVRSNTAREILRANRAEAARRHAVAARVLSAFAWRAERFSYHGWLELPDGWATSEFVTQARRAALIVTPGDAFAVSGRCDPPSVRLSMTAPPDRDALADALGRIARLLELGPRASPSIL